MDLPPQNKLQRLHLFNYFLPHLKMMEKKTVVTQVAQQKEEEPKGLKLPNSGAGVSPQGLAWRGGTVSHTQVPGLCP